MTIPVIDDRVRHIGVSALRGLNAKALRELIDMLVIQVDDKPAAVIIPIAMYMEIQEALWPSSLLPSLDLLFGKVIERNGGAQANPDMQHSVDTFMQSTEIYTDESRKALGCKCTPEATDPQCVLTNHRGRVIVHGLSEEESKEPRGHRLSAEEERDLRDNPPPIILDDIDGGAEDPPLPEEAAISVPHEEVFFSAPGVRRCGHCGEAANPTAVGDPALDKLAALPIICPRCFMDGHRNDDGCPQEPKA